MTLATQPESNRSPTRLSDAVDALLDKGVVVDAYTPVSLIGIETLQIDACFAVVSLDTYLRVAEQSRAPSEGR
jgi:gas vesicle structural protein